MRNRRQEYVVLTKEMGLPVPDDRTLEFLRLVVDEGTLGASKHIGLVHELFIHLMERQPDKDQAWREVNLAAEFLARVRGIDTPVITNSIGWVLRSLDSVPPDGREEEIKRRSKLWKVQATQRLSRLVEVGVNTLGERPVVVAFDYSSTVEALIKVAFEKGKSPKVIVLESRAIAGGEPYFLEFLGLGLDVHYVPDMALEFVIPDATAVLLGVESLRCDGSFLNTIGSRIVARTANLYHVDVYACTDLFKLDARSYKGHFKKPTLRSYDELLLKDLHAPLQGSFSTSAPELEVINSSLISGFITDYGTVSPAQIWALGREALPEVKETSI